MINRIILNFFFILIWICYPLVGLQASEPNYPILKSASELDYPPFSIVKEDGTVDGFSVELLQAVTSASSLTVSFEIGPWSEIKQKLIDGHLDVLPLVSYSKERDKVLDFTSPYLRMTGTIFVRKGDNSIHKESDLRGKEVLVMEGDTAHEYAIKNKLTENLILTETFEQAMNLLAKGEHDAVIVQQLVGEQLIIRLGITNVVNVGPLKEETLKPIMYPLSGFEQKFCLAVQEGNNELLKRLNEGLTIIITNGTYQELYNKWFGPILPKPSPSLKEIIKYILMILIPLIITIGVIGIVYLKREISKKTGHLQKEIQDKRTIEAELRASEHTFSQMFMQSSTSTCFYNPEGTIIRVNDEFCKMFGVKEHEILTSEYNLFKDQAIIESGVVQTINEIFENKVTRHWEIDFDIAKASESTGTHTSKPEKVYLEVFGYPVLNDKGDLEFVVLKHYDISKRKGIETKLINNEKFLDSIIEQSPYPTWISDINGTMIKTNPSFISLFNLTGKQLIGDYNVFKDKNVDQTVVQKISKALEKNTVEGFELKWDNKNGNSTIYCDGVAFPIFNQADEITHVVITLKDVSEKKKIELNLKESEEKYRQLFESINDAVLVHLLEDDGTPGRFIEANDLAVQRLGYTRDELLKLTPINIRSKELNIDPSAITKKLQQAGSLLLETTHKTKEGELIPVESSLQLFNYNGKKCVLSIARDISERKEMEEQYRAVVDNVGDYIMRYDENCRHIYANRLAIEATGLSVDEYIGKNHREMGFPEHLCKLWEKNIQSVFESGKQQRIEFDVELVEGNMSLDMLLTPEFAPDGSITSVIGISRDVTERKTAEERLKENESFVSSVLENLPIGIAVNSVNPNVSFEYMNDNFFKYYRITKEAINEPDAFWDAVYEDPKFRKEIKTRVLEDCESGDPKRMHWEDIPIVRKGESTTYITARNIPLSQKGLMISTVWDVTQRMKMESRLQQAQKMEAIGNLAGGIAHDFNNILFPIIGMSELLLEDLQKDSPEYENAQEVLTAGKRGAELVKQILAFSRQSENKLIPLRIQQVMKEVLKLVRSTLPSNIEIKQDIQQNCGLVMADSTQVHQIVMNLITNAYHAVESNEGHIEVQLVEKNIDKLTQKKLEIEAGRYAVLIVSDTGCGIKPEMLKTVFEPYFTTKEQGKGTGLGLAVVHGIVKEYGGDIHVTSELGKGSIFEVYIPLMKRKTDSQVAEEIIELPTGTEKILVVDDEISVAKLETQILQRLGYEVTTSTNSVEAFTLVEKDPDMFDLVITDMTMPNLTGDVLAKKILNVRRDIPIIICTGFSEKIDKDHPEKIGVKGLLMKPVVKSDMARMVRELLDKQNTN